MQQYLTCLMCILMYVVFNLAWLVGKGPIVVLVFMLLLYFFGNFNVDTEIKMI